MFIRSLVIIAFLLFVNACISVRTVSFAQKAQSLENNKKFEQAIELYRKHFEMRLADRSRNDDENPFFYFVLIGDNYLKLNKPEEAKTAYDTAKINDVKNNILADRYRQLAQYYKNLQQFETAITLLRQYRDLDALAFDYDIDALHKEMIAKDDETK